MDTDDRTNVVVLGRGGREHALAWKLAQSPYVRRVCVLPGNGGMTALVGPRRVEAVEQKICPVAIEAMDSARISAFALEYNAKLVVPGPDLPLVSGIADDLAMAGVPVFGPSRRAARLTEGSKCAAKDFMTRHDIPTAPYRHFGPGDEAELDGFLKGHPLPIVVKDDQLAQGKGVTIAKSREDARIAAIALFRRTHRALIERFIRGFELSFTCLVAGECYIPLALAQDHKWMGDRVTGGMGVVSSDGLADSALYRRTIESIVKPTVRGLQKEGAPFVGFLYIGLIVADGFPYVCEYNCRFGDPEAQAVLLRLWSDLYPALRAALAGRLDEVKLDWNPRPAVTLVLASAGYPGEPQTGDAISGLEQAIRMPGVRLFSAGIEHGRYGQLCTAGGRVLNVNAIGNTVAEARARAYDAAHLIHWPGMQMVRTIGEGL
ncbi:MAG: phosphoribosylamine--glycine ligase [Candidatus Sungbacteria bacterium]|uniref:phosphoribosylamine--glycine ligase n=1 Tax=Candidatus Sungiibacteriota bacterium TaxID=2750080 RepID=A0A932YVR8_9BACT|nr:phosphoribosylamine--glycine ligase [Candidatus Sungbacteria bacterium]